MDLKYFVDELNSHFKKYIVDIKHVAGNEESIPKTFVTFKLLNYEWQVSTDFFTEWRSTEAAGKNQ